MVDNFKLHDKIVEQLFVNDFDFNIIDKIKKDSYFFIGKNVDNNFLFFMKKRKKSMEMVIGYSETILKLSTYFRLKNDSIFCGKFILSSNSYYVFFDGKEENILSIYNSPHLYKDKIIRLNREYEASNLKLIEYESKNQLV